MGQTLARLLDLPDPESKATHLARTHSRHARWSNISKASVDSVRAPLKPSHRTLSRQDERSRSHRDRRSRLLTETDGNARPKRSRGNGSPSRPHRIRKAETQHKEKNAEGRKTRSGVSHGDPKIALQGKRHRESRSRGRKHAEVTRMRDLEPKKDCLVCTESRSHHRFPQRPPTTQCAHEVSTCRHCLRSWIRSEFESKVWDQINCPECGIRMQYEDILEFAHSDVFRHYDRLSTKAALESIPGFQWCIAKGCKSGQVHDEGSLTPRFRCIACKASHCTVHQVVWHKGETCAEYDYRTDSKLKKAEESASKKLLKDMAKRCPGCKWNIEKTYGCDHMTCSKCRHEFCWVCLAPYGPIRKRGSQMHRPSCAHFQFG